MTLLWTPPKNMIILYTFICFTRVSSKTTHVYNDNKNNNDNDNKNDNYYGNDLCNDNDGNDFSWDPTVVGFATF